MASTIKVNTLDSYTGTNITVPTGKTLTVGGKLVTAGSSNIQRATGDVTVATTADYDVSGKSELVIAANASAATRTITLCPVTETGADTCIITIVADADATSTYKLTVLESDGATEVWTGYAKNDFVRLIVSNSAWLVVDHKETIYSHRYMTADQTISSSATEKLTGNGNGWTSIRDIGNTWDTANNRLDTPTGMNGYWTVSHNIACAAQHIGNSPVLYIGGSKISAYDQGGANTSGYTDGQNGVTGKYYATSTQAAEFYAANRMSSTAYTTTGGSASASHFTAQFERVY